MDYLPPIPQLICSEVVYLYLLFIKKFKNYTLHQLQVFLKITQTKSITKAVEELHLTQPAVSIQLKNLQNQFEVPLTEVIRRKLYLTDFEKKLAIFTQNIINQVYAINYKTLAFRGQLSERLKISIVSTGKYVIPYFLTDFLKKHDGIELIMDVANKAKVIESLVQNEVDFSLVSVLPEHLIIDRISLMSNKLYLVANTDQSFNQQEYDISILEELPMIYREKGSGTQQTMEQFINKYNLPVKKKMELSTNEAVNKQ